MLVSSYLLRPDLQRFVFNKHRHAITIIGYYFINMHSGVVERMFAFNLRVFS